MLYFGEIYWAQLPHNVNSSVQSGLRPVLVVSNNTCNRFSPVITVVPLTSKQKSKHLPTHVTFCGEGLLRESQILCEQILSIDKKLLDRRIGIIQNEEILKQIICALMVQLNMNGVEPVCPVVPDKDTVSDKWLKRLYSQSEYALKQLSMVS